MATEHDIAKWNPAWLHVHEKPPLCQCGCREPVRISRHTVRKYGFVKGQPFRFKGGHQRRLLPNKSREVVRNPHGRGVVVVARAIAERALGHRLPPEAEVHHVDGDPQNDAPTNLVICQDHAYHELLHIRTRVWNAGANPNTHLFCHTCEQAKPIDVFVKNPRTVTGRNSLCKACFNRQRREQRHKSR